ncbi:MAG TPA: class I SAM-dependent methyltransferase [Amycolatopsis sp.]|nr:class I SAM-dependent methyltransferase [Amycolatopsis sp.]
MSVPLDFDQLYQGNPAVRRDGFVPWDIGEPQPLLVEVEAAGEVRGEVLDAGCGLADNTLFLAERGYRVTGIDAAPTAIERARTKAGDRGLTAEFAVADATRLDGFTARFDTVIDSALYHCLDDEQQHAYAAALHRACRPGATLHLFCRSDLLGDLPGPRALGEDNVCATFGDGWRRTRLRRRSYTTAFSRQMLIRAAAEAGTRVDAERLPLDDRGRYLMPVWQLTAIREP